jgi:hypothetical protein
MNVRTLRLLLLALIVAEAALWFFGPQPKDHLPDIAAATAAGKRPDWWDDAALGVHYAAAVCGGLFVLLLASANLWYRPISDSEPNPKPKTQNPKFFWPLILAASLLCLGLRLPLASKSLWWDEAWVIEQVSLGRWKPDSKQPDKLKFQAHDWSRCAWYYQKPTNHAPMSLLQKASITAWQKFTHAKKEQFSDLSARVPALLASCIAIIFLGLLLREWGSPGAGVAAAFVLAIHPWHIRYGVDARAYALVVPLCIGGMLAITRIVKARGKNFLPWLGWGITEFLWLWAYPNAALDITALNIVAAVLLWKNHSNARDRWTALFRLAATNVFAASCLVQAFLPNLIQARHWAGQEADKHVLDPALAASTLSQLIFGCEYWLPNNKPAIFPQFNHSIATPPVATFLIATTLGILLLWILLLVRRKKVGTGAACLSALLISSVAFATVTWALQSYFYPRFIIALLPVCIASCCLVIAMLRWRFLALVAATVFSVFYANSAYFYAMHPYQPLHDVASFIQTESNRESKLPLVACYGLGREVMPVYYPACVPLENAADLTKLQKRAQAEQRPLYVTYGYDNFNRSMLGDGFKTLDDRTQFDILKFFDGIEPEFTFRVLRAK